MTSTYPKSTTITALRIYPIKSCRGISIRNSTLTRQGLKYDRKWMFVDASHQFVTIRSKPEMTLIRTGISNDQNLEITFPSITVNESTNEKYADYENATTVTVPLEPSKEYLDQNTNLINAEIWKYETDAYAYTASVVNDAIALFFKAYDSEAMVQLVLKGPTPRQCTGNGDPQYLGRKEHVNFSDVLPIQVASEKSLAELNSRLRERGEEAIPIERFRPNIIVDSDNLTAWEEDEWKLLRINPPKTAMESLSTFTGIGSATLSLDVQARCARCQVPNVDTVSAKKHSKEPWSVLYGYRRVDEGIKVKPCFGMLCCPRNEGYVELGMSMEIAEVMEAAGGIGKHHYVKGF